MKKLIIYIIVASLLPFALLGAEREMPSIAQPVSVKMYGVIPPRDLQIVITDEEGNELSAEEAVINFDFPSTEQWEVSQSLHFSYSSHLATRKSGMLSFQIDDFSLDESNELQIAIELKSANPMTLITSPNTFSISFLDKLQEKTPIGTLTVRIRKSADDVFSAGTYTGAFLMNYTEGS